MIVSCKINIEYRNPQKFTDQFLTMDYGEQKIVVLTIQDNYQSYAIKQPFINKVRLVFLIVTAPEIEMLRIHSLNLYEDFQKEKSKTKPSKFIANYFSKRGTFIKKEDFIVDFYSKYSLEEAIKIHARKTKRRKGILLLSDILDC